MKVSPLLTVFALAGPVGVCLLAAACAGSPGTVVAAVGTTAPATTTSASTAASSRQSAALAFSRCMRAHGVPNFPDPDAQGSFPSFSTGVAKQTSSAANEVCRHLLPGGGTGTPQQRQQKLAFALNVARCLRKHGFPTFPDPTAAGQTIPPGISTRSPQFQAAVARCEEAGRKALGLQ
jgi:hypothetical protein